MLCIWTRLDASCSIGPGTTTQRVQLDLTDNQFCRACMEPVAVDFFFHILLQMEVLMMGKQSLQCLNTTLLGIESLSRNV